MALDKAKIAHLLRAAAVVTGHTYFVMVGSGSTIARYAPIPLQMLETREIDLYIEGDADATDAMAILLGQDSPFDVTHGYYVDGVSPTTAQMPDDWRDRAKEVTLPMAAGIVCLCPEANDIALAKMCAWREKDVEWLQAGLMGGLLRLYEMQERVGRIRHDGAPPEGERIRRIGMLAAMIAP